MYPNEIQKLRSLTSFEALVDYLRDELDWPIEVDDVEKVAFDYNPKELGIDPVHAVKIESIRQIRPLAEGQPWGIFYIEFESKQLPVIVLRRILRALVPNSRSRDPNRPAWKLSDLLFISSQGEVTNRSISFAHFRQNPDGKPELRTFSWDIHETHLYYIENLNLNALRWPEQPLDANQWRTQWSQAFTVPHRYVPETAEMLAREMARIARDIHDAVQAIYNIELAGGPLHQLYLSLKMYLISDLSESDFADMYAQTVTYGLFAARATRSGDFGHSDAPALIAHTNPFLRELLEQMMNQQELDLDELGVSELTEMLGKVDMEAILRDFGRQKRGEDPVIHFYETFMRAYDPKQKTKRGEFYTPDPVVSFIVRSVDYLLRTEFGCEDGLATPAPKDKTGFDPIVLDPATGTGTFLKYVIEVIWETFYEKYKKMSAAERRVKWNRFIRENVLPRLYGFELKMSPYTIAHMKVGLALKEKGFDFEEGERLRIYLTNALQPAHEVMRVDTPALAHEAERANEVKNHVPVTVVIGNPPYSVSSSNTGEWITDLVKKSYYPKDSIREHNPKLILDDYIKFYRFGQWKIDKSRHGILAFITNHGYLDGPIFRSMRLALIQNYSEIYILNLHGNSKTKETAPDGSKDENVFDIQQGVAICLMVRRMGFSGSARVFYTDLYGNRNFKYEWLLSHHRDASSVTWKEIHPEPPLYRFKPQENRYSEEYNNEWSIFDIFSITSTGIKTHRDHFVISFDKKTLEDRITEFRDLRIDNQTIREKFDLPDTRDWKLPSRRLNLSQDKNWHTYFTQCLYRPFDIREIYYNSNVIELPRPEIMENLLKPNLCLLTMRRIRTNEYRHFLVSNKVVGKDAVSLEDACSVFPLYLYTVSVNTIRQRHFLDIYLSKEGERIPNLSQKFINELSTRLDLKYLLNRTGDLTTTFGPEDIFHYMYAAFHSPTYRNRYSEFLKIDYPHLPLTSNLELFSQLCGLGNKLVALHLLEAPTMENPITQYSGQGDHSVAKGYPKYQDGAVMVNPTQGFEGVPESVWEFYIGGYQVCHKWVKDRRGRQLSAEDIAHFQKIVLALSETIRLMQEIDKVIDDHGGWPIY